MRCMCIVVGGGLAMVMAMAAGCSSGEPDEAVQRRMDTVDSVQEMRRDLTRADAQVAETEQSLDRLATQRAGDLEKTYKQFASDVKGNESISNRLGARSSALSSVSYRQLNEWSYQSRTIRDEGLRQKSLRQEAAAKREHDEMMTRLNDLRGAYTNYIRALEDIETFAANSLTPQGLSGLADERAKAGELAADLRKKMALVDGQLDHMAAMWRPDVPLAERVREETAVPAATQVGGARQEDGVITANHPVRGE